ncbi:hypothetical protein [Pseudomonas sp. B33.4]|uniref:hypothetical protein n=1 Tax=Pseudomonas sp. B33.4 TaxID=3104265 RepID=UPI002ADEF469|nr:hypothetical protein [Pseudomonas sp. B33.4]
MNTQHDVPFCVPRQQAGISDITYLRRVFRANVPNLQLADSAGQLIVTLLGGLLSGVLCASRRSGSPAVSI